MTRLRVADAAYPIQAILFDKDGTLLDFIYTWGNWSERLLARFSRRLEERGLAPLSMDTDTLWGTRRASDGELAGYDRNGPLATGTLTDLLTVLAWQGYRAGLTWPEAKVLAEECREYADERMLEVKAVRALPGVVKFLDHCRERGIVMAVVTADETAMAVRHLEWLGMTEYFSAIIGTDQVERGKPCPDMVELACRRLNVDVARVAVIGDTNGDMRMARSAGAAVAVGIAGPDADEAAGSGNLPDADAVILSYGELEIVEGES
ncbi:HAD family hydrolase [Cohnella suwonensis]|uniref:HAD family hydrolase n=1 Tax=Cohnella suwonensis TaxID=696072 RepID=A0ABW0LYM1_9BACL